MIFQRYPNAFHQGGIRLRAWKALLNLLHRGLIKYRAYQADKFSIRQGYNVGKEAIGELALTLNGVDALMSLAAARIKIMTIVAARIAVARVLVGKLAKPLDIHS
jgi:hypothetical protein